MRPAVSYVLLFARPPVSRSFLRRWMFPASAKTQILRQRLRHLLWETLARPATHRIFGDFQAGSGHGRHCRSAWPRGCQPCQSPPFLKRTVDANRQTTFLSHLGLQLAADQGTRKSSWRHHLRIAEGVGSTPPHTRFSPTVAPYRVNCMGTEHHVG